MVVAVANLRLALISATLGVPDHDQASSGISIRSFENADAVLFLLVPVVVYWAIVLLFDLT